MAEGYDSSVCVCVCVCPPLLRPDCLEMFKRADARLWRPGEITTFDLSGRMIGSDRRPSSWSLFLSPYQRKLLFTDINAKQGSVS